MEYPATTATVDFLPNGLAVILDPDPGSEVVSAQWWVETGSIHEGSLLGSGVSHFLEHMVFKGTRDFSADQLADVVQAAGGHWNAYTSFDRTVYYIDGPAGSLPLFLRCLSGMVLFPNLPESEFDREKEVIRREIDMGLDDPDSASLRLMLTRAFRHDPRRHPVIGHRTVFDALTYRDLTGYHHRRYTPGGGFVVISGGFDPAETIAYIRELTKDAVATAAEEAWVPEDAPQMGPRHGRETFAIPDSRLSLAWKIPALEDPATPSFEILAAVLGQGRSSRLYRRLREERGMALEISAFAWNFPAQEGLFGVAAHCEPHASRELIDAIHEEVRRIGGEDLREECEKAKRLIAASQFRQLVTASGRAADLASNWHEARDLDFTRHHVAAVMAVTPDNVKAAAARLVDRSLTTTVLDPLDTPSPANAGKTRTRSGGITTHTLSNGLRIALVRDARVPLIHLQAAAFGGLPVETSATSGINQLTASCLPKGTASHDASRIAATLESLGASASASAGNNSLQIQAAGLAPDIATIAHVWSEMMVAPSFPDAAVAREKASQLAAWRESQTDPLHAGFRALRSIVFGDTGYGFDLLGNGDSLATLDRLALETHRARCFQASNMSVAVAGDIDPPAVLDLLESGFASLPMGCRLVAPASEIRESQETTVRLPKKQAVLCVGFPCAAASHGDTHALALLNEYVSDMAGPLFTRIREELGLAYQVGATRFHGHDTGLFTFYLATSPDQIDLAREELMKQIATLASSGVPADSFEAARATVLSGLALRQQSSAQSARQAVIDMLFGLPADHHLRLPEIIRQLSPREVVSVAHATFGATPSISVVLPDGNV